MRQNWLIGSEDTRARLLQAIMEMPITEPMSVQISQYLPTRSQEQNRKMWGCLHDISEHVNWYGKKLTAENWKDVLSASLKKQEAVPGIDGGFVILGARTSKMTIQEMTEMIELCLAFGAQQGVTFKEGT